MGLLRDSIILSSNLLSVFCALLLNQSMTLVVMKYLSSKLKTIITRQMIISLIPNPLMPSFQVSFKISIKFVIFNPLLQFLFQFSELLPS